jgi:hypothetical protein
MERVYLYKVFQNRYAKFFYAFSFLLLLYGLFFLVRIHFFKIDSSAFGSITSLSLISLQGLITLIQYLLALKNGTYYIEWNDREINYLMPNSKKIETIELNDIRSINVRLFEVYIGLSDSERVIRFENLEYATLIRIKDKFEEIKKQIT